MGYLASFVIVKNKTKIGLEIAIAKGKFCLFLRL